MFSYRFSLKHVFYACLATKILVSLFFSSGYKEIFFMPFLEHFIQNGGNPWNYFYINPVNVEFPYHPLMLYILSFFTYIPITLFDSHWFLTNAFFKLPLILADLTIFWMLIKLFPDNKKDAFLYYFLSPIIIFSTYMHSQLDIIPTAFLFASIYFIYKKKWTVSSIIFSFGLLTKLHIIVVLPLILIFIYRNTNLKQSLKWIVLPLIIYSIFVIPYLIKPGFFELVLTNPQQSLLLDSSLSIGPHIIYISLLFITITYSLFILNYKINSDLLISNIGIIFLLILLTVKPAPGWYVWIFPYISIFMIKFRKNKLIKSNKLTTLYFSLNIVYLLFFLFFNQMRVPVLTLFESPIDLLLTTTMLSDIIFTGIQTIIVLIIMSLWLIGVKSNSLFQLKEALLIGIGGDSGSGKSTLKSHLSLLFSTNTTTLETDGVHKWERHDENWNKLTHHNPKANLLYAFADQIKSLKENNPTSIRFYDHKTGTFTPHQLIYPKPFIILSGLHPFYLPQMRQMVDIKIFLDTDETLQQFWKYKRDIIERGHDFETIKKSIETRKKDAQTHIQTQKKCADLIVNFYPREPLNFNKTNILDLEPEINMKLQIRSDINLDPFIQEFENENCLINWDYAQDLNSIIIDFKSFLDPKKINKLAHDNLFNLDTIIDEQIQWNQNHSSTLQLMVLVITHHLIIHQKHD